MYRFEETSGIDGLDRIQPHWQSLSQRLPICRFFHRWQWHRAYIRHLFNQQDAVRFLMLFRGKTPVVVFPYTIHKEKLCGMGLRVLGFPYHPHLPLLDALIDPGTEDVFPILVQHLKQRTDIEWDVLRCTRLLKGACILRHAEHWRDPSLISEKASASAFIRCDREAPHTEYLTAKFRRNINRLKRRAAQRGVVSFDYVRGQEELQAAFEDFLRVEAAGWKGEQGAGSAIALDPSLTCFYRDITVGFGNELACQINRMYIDDRCVAAQLSLLCDRVLYILKIGYDEEYKDMAPGSLLLNDLIHRCTDDADIDSISLVTCPPWAERWHVDKIDVYRLTVINNTVKASFYRKVFALKRYM